MDGTRFDQLIKSMAATRITRLTALRGLAVGAVAAATGFAASDDVDAKKRCSECQKKKTHKSNNGKKRIRCKAKANGTPCSIGTCLNSVCTRAVSPLSPLTPPLGFSCTAGTETGCTGGQVCNAAGNACVACTSFLQCTGDRVCIDGVCRGDEACGGPGGFKCPEPFNCEDIPGSNIDLCKLDTECLFDPNRCDDTSTFVEDAFCLSGECVTTCETSADCVYYQECFNGVCFRPY